MKSNAIRLYGKNDIRLDTLEIPNPKPNELLVKIIVDSQCTSTLKEIALGNDHSRTPNNLESNPVIIGHELAGVIEEVGADYTSQFTPGQRFTLQPPLYHNQTHYAVGYSFPYLGGLTQYALIGPEVLETESFHIFQQELPFFAAALSEPLSCIISSHKEILHKDPGGHSFHFGLKPGGNTAILGGCGPMGLLQLAYCLYGPSQPNHLFVTEVDEQRLAQAKTLFPPSEAEQRGVSLRYLNPTKEDVPTIIQQVTQNALCSEVFVMIAHPAVVEMTPHILGEDGFLSFFAGPKAKDFMGSVNFYDVHYRGIKIGGTSCGWNDDLHDALRLFENSDFPYERFVSAVAGLSVSPYILTDIMTDPAKNPAGKILVYPHAPLPLVFFTPDQPIQTDQEIPSAYSPFLANHHGYWSKALEDKIL